MYKGDLSVINRRVSNYSGMTDMNDGLTAISYSTKVKFQDFLSILKIPKLCTYITIYFICIFQEITFTTFVAFLDTLGIPIYSSLSLDSLGWIFTGLSTFFLLKFTFPCILEKYGYIQSLKIMFMIQFLGIMVLIPMSILK